MTELDLFLRLRTFFPDGQYAVLKQVANSTGFSASRTIDAVVFSCWPSQGLWAASVEIKSAKSDLERELEKPEKADAFAKFMDFHYLLIADAAWIGQTKRPIPAAWGILAPHGDGLRVKKTPEKIEAELWTRNLVCAMARQMAKQISVGPEIDAIVAERIEQERRKWKETEDERKPYEIKRAEDNAKELHDRVSEFEAASGVSIRHNYGLKSIGAAAKALANIGFGDRARVSNSLRANGADLIKAAAELDALFLEMGETKDATPTARPPEGR